MASKKFAAVDLGTCSGWAIVDQGRVIAYGSANVAHSGACKASGRFIKFNRFLEKLHYEHKVDEIYYEDVMRWSSSAAAKVYCGLLCVLQVFAHQQKIGCYPVSVTTIKKHATGKGNAKKSDMIGAANNILELKTNALRKTKDDNCADAICLADYVYENL